MKKLTYFLIFFPIFFTTIASSQEICNNGIDDDGDGVIDINDPDCLCSVNDVIIGDFEGFDCCPEGLTDTDNPSGINCLNDGWVSASNATPDFYNTCGYLGEGDIIPNPPIPFPSGEGVVGFIGEPNWKEYIGICIPSNMIPGEEYEISFSVGFNDALNATNISSLNVEIGLFGRNDCSNVPAFTAQCITTASGWYEIETFNITSLALDTWVGFSGTFVAAEATNFIAFGHSCDFANSQNLYHFLDNIIIEGPFGDQMPEEEVVLTGDCVNGVFVEAQNSSADSYQWYLDGVFIPSATTNPYLIPAGATGEYQVYMEFSDGTCAISEIVDVFVSALDIDPFMDLEDCTSVALPIINGTDLTGNESYFTGQGGTGAQFFSGQIITSSIQLFAFNESNGCSDEEILNITIFEDIDAGADQTICLGDEITLTGNSSSPSITWDNGVLDGVPFTPAVTQDYTATTDDDCIDVVTVTVVPSPDIDPFMDIEGCTSVTLPTINGTNLTGNESYFTGPEGTGTQFFSGDMITSSIELFAFDGVSGCIDEEILNITIQDFVQISILELTLDCNDPQGNLNLQTNSNIDIFTWSGPNGFSSSEASPMVTTPGIYDVIVTDDLGCMGTASIEVGSDFGIPDIFATGGSTDCTQNTLEISGGSNSSIVSTEWDGPSGFNANVPNPQVSLSGDYTFTVTGLNGCTNSTIVQVVIDEAVELDVYYHLEQPLCEEDLTGTIIIDSLEGGIGPFSYSFDNENFYSLDSIGGGVLDSIENLYVGDYDFYVIDEAGPSCVNDFSFSIENPIPFDINIGEDTTIHLGNSVPILMNSTIPFGQLEWTWSDSSSLSCNDCINPIAIPLTSTSYILEAINLNGCIALDTVNVKLIEDYNIYIPNAFTPNEDGANDFFVVYPDLSIVEISNIEVFSRWGELVYRQTAYDPHDNAFFNRGWDGRFNGKEMSQGVFVYRAEFRLLNGQRVTLTGDVTLVR